VTGHVFLTFSATDATDPYIQAVIGRLGAAGLSVHAQQEVNGSAVTPATRKLVDACGALVPVIMPSTGSSDRVRLEVEYAHARGKPVLALWVSGVVPEWLAFAEIDSVEGRRPPSSEFVAKLRDIALASAGAAVPVPPAVGLRPERPGPGLEPKVTGRPPPPDQPPWLDLTPEQATGLLPRLDPGRAPQPPSAPIGRVWLVLAVLGGLAVLLVASAGVVYVIAR
jgi:hypothetical protein